MLSLPSLQPQLKHIPDICWPVGRSSGFYYGFVHLIELRCGKDLFIHLLAIAGLFPAIYFLRLYGA